MAVNQRRPIQMHYCAEDGSQLAAATEAALNLLSDAGRLLFVSADQPADVVHTVGAVDPVGAACTAPRVHTVDRIPVRTARLAHPGWWIRGERSRVWNASRCIVHGNTATRMMVDTGLVPGERVNCLPLLAPATMCSDQSVGQRTELRARLGVAPGVRLLLTTAPDLGCLAAVRWYSRLHSRRRSDLTALFISPDGTGKYRVARPDGSTLPGAPSLADLLWSADLYVATATRLEGCSVAVAAAAAGLPLVASTTDSAAELVLANGNGCVVEGRPDRIVQAIAAQLDSGRPFGRRRVPQLGEQQRLVEFARLLLGQYRRAITSNSVGAVA